MKNSELLIHDYSRNFMEKVFYFCLKKTGDPNSAEELCSDISFAVISALKKGAVPENFAAWVWQVARNRHADYAEKRRIWRERTGDADISEYDDLDDGSEAPIDRLIRDEDLMLMRRELAFISGEYRLVIVAFYINDRSISDISRSLNLPEGTVKSKLHRARKILKEGINMAREFGSRSYKPEDVTFNASYSSPSPEGLPWSAVDRKTQKNILLEASNNPSTVEELAIALGIAVPYMEEEVEILTKATLLKKDGDKYVTNFPILSAETQKEIYHIGVSRAKQRAEYVANIANDSLEKIRALGCVRNGKISNDDLKWWVVCSICHVSSMISSDFRAPLRENGERWGFVGYEECDLPFSGWLSNNNCGNNRKAVIRHFIPHSFNIAQGFEEPYDKANHAALLADIIRNKRNISTLNEIEKELWKEIDGVYAHADESGNVIPDILIFEGGGYYCDVPDTAIQIYSAHPDYNRLLEFDAETHGMMIEALKKVNSPVLAEQLSFTASMAENMDGLSLIEIVESGVLTAPADPEHFRATMDLWIK